MFTKLFPKMAKSDEGFVVQTKDRNTLQYIEGKEIIFEVYTDFGEIVFFHKKSLKAVKLPTGVTQISDAYKEKIIERISAAADFLGWKYEWY